MDTGYDETKPQSALQCESSITWVACGLGLQCAFSSGSHSPSPPSKFDRMHKHMSARAHGCAMYKNACGISVCPCACACVYQHASMYLLSVLVVQIGSVKIRSISRSLKKRRNTVKSARSSFTDAGSPVSKNARRPEKQTRPLRGGADRQTCSAIHEAKNLVAHRGVLVAIGTRPNLPLLYDHEQKKADVESEYAKMLISDNHLLLAL